MAQGETQVMPDEGVPERGFSAPLLQVAGLSVYVHTPKGRLPAVEDVSFDIAEGETLCLVGESASGKSLTALSILGLHGELVQAVGEITLRGRSLLGLSDAEFAAVRGREIAMIFQEAIPALNPVQTVGRQLVEAIRSHRSVSKPAARELAAQHLASVGIRQPARCLRSYPHALSGGMAQRAMIAMALAASPVLLIADEPTTALDVTIQAQILDLLQALRASHGLAMLLISHDMGVVAEMADRVAVMYAGRIVEIAPVEALFDMSLHPYSQALLAARPSFETGRRQKPTSGEAPGLDGRGAGCAFAPRCPRASAVCRTTVPPDQSRNGRRFACHNPLDAPS